LCTILVVFIVAIFLIRSFLFLCVLCKNTFQTNPNSITDFSKLFFLLQTTPAPASLFYLVGYKTPPKMSESERRDLLRKAKQRTKQVFDDARNTGQLATYKRNLSREDIDGRGKIKNKDFERALEQMDMRKYKSE
tara:strand:- start:267 stop:671 length:405 start_codon:yes stop_codon:yes gene_type:complete